MFQSHGWVQIILRMARQRILQREPDQNPHKYEASCAVLPVMFGRSSVIVWENVVYRVQLLHLKSFFTLFQVVHVTALLPCSPTLGPRGAHGGIQLILVLSFIPRLAGVPQTDTTVISRKMFPKTMEAEFKILGGNGLVAGDTGRGCCLRPNIICPWDSFSGIWRLFCALARSSTD